MTVKRTYEEEEEEEEMGVGWVLEAVAASCCLNLAGTLVASDLRSWEEEEKCFKRRRSKRRKRRRRGRQLGWDRSQQPTEGLLLDPSIMDGCQRKDGPI